MTIPVDKSWVVTTASERMTPDSWGRAETTVTVTNLHDSALPATLAIITSDDATKGWFSVADAERVVEAGASAPFVVTVIVPPDARPAEYAFHALVRNTGAAENEEGVRSNEVLLTLAPPADTRGLRKHRIKTVTVIVAAIVVVASLVGGSVLLRSPKDRQSTPLPSPSTPTPLASPSTSDTAAVSRIAVPDVRGATDVEAIAETLDEAGLVPVIRYLYRPSGGGAIDQNPSPQAEVSPGDVVEVTYAANISAPAKVAVEVQLRPLPAGVDINKTVVADVELAWEQAEAFVTSWQILFFRHICESNVDGGYLATGVGKADITRFRAARLVEAVPFTCPSPPEAAFIVAVDDFGNPGPMSEFIPINFMV